MLYVIFFFFKQKTAYEMRISDWSSDVCSSDLAGCRRLLAGDRAAQGGGAVHRADRLPRHQEGRPESRADRAIRPVAVPHAVPGRRTRRSGYKIGRASCRERVCQYVEISVVTVSLKNKQNHHIRLLITHT